MQGFSENNPGGKNNWNYRTVLFDRYSYELHAWEKKIMLSTNRVILPWKLCVGPPDGCPITCIRRVCKKQKNKSKTRHIFISQHTFSLYVHRYYRNEYMQ